MKKLIVLLSFFCISSIAFAEPKVVELGGVGSCMRTCVQYFNPSKNVEALPDNISIDENTLDCVNYCNPNLKEGYCSTTKDGCCNITAGYDDYDCKIPQYQACTIESSNSRECKTGVCQFGTNGTDVFALWCNNLEPSNQIEGQSIEKELNVSLATKVSGVCSGDSI